MSSEPALYSLYMPSRFEIIFALVLLPFVILTLPTPAFAHATPIQYVPDASSVLSQTPAEVRIHFSERVEPNVSSIVVFAPDGSRADLPGAGVDGSDPRTYRTALKNGG